MAARLIAICGPMFSGKSSELVRRLRAASEQRLAVAAVKPVLDDRYAQREIVTHAGERVPAHAVHDAGEIQGAVGLASVVAIDEAHFFGSLLTGSLALLTLLRRRIEKHCSAGKNRQSLPVILFSISNRSP